MTWTLEDLNIFRTLNSPIITEINNISWTFYDIGNVDSQITLVFLHGTIGGKEIFWLPIKSLMKDFRIISFDLPAIIGVEKLSEGIHNILVQRGVHSAILIGTSFGGYLAQDFSHRYPELVQKLVLANTFISTELYHKKYGNLLKIEKIIPGFVLKRFMKRSLLKIKHDSTQKYLVHQLETNLDKKTLLTRLKSFINQSSLEKAPIEDILIIETQKDPLISQELQEDLKSTYAQYKVKKFSEEASHFPYLTQSEKDYQVLYEFIIS